MNNRIKKLEITFIIILVLTLIIHFIDSGTKHIKGDGYEYALTSQSFVDHLTPDARLEDIYQLHANIVKNARFHIGAEKIFSGYEDLVGNKTDTAFGYFKTDDNQYYCYHFWLYPLVNAPALWLTEILQWSPVRSFHITNIVIFLLTLIFLTTNKFLNKKQKYFISVFYIVCGTTYYVSWSHPEVFSGSLLLIGLVLLLDKRFILSALLFSLAAQQNPPIGIPAVFALLLQFFITTKLFLKNKIPMTPAIKTYVALGGISLILLLSPLFYYWHFHTTNLIVKYGGSIHNLISLKRLYSIYFDYNQGIIVASLFAMIIIFFLILLYAVIPALRQRFKTKQHIIIALLMLILSIVIAIPALSAPNWNPGQCIFLRYGYWISMPLGVAAMLLIAELPLCFYLPTFLFFILGQSLILYKHTITGREDYLENKPIAIYFFENYPNLYNPIPVIFIERGLHTETGADINKIYLYVNKNSKITKILYHQSNFSPTILCQNQSINDLRKSNVSVATEQGWFYINFTNNSCSTDYQPGFHSI